MFEIIELLNFVISKKIVVKSYNLKLSSIFLNLYHKLYFILILRSFKIILELTLYTYIF